MTVCARSPASSRICERIPRSQGLLVLLARFYVQIQRCRCAVLVSVGASGSQFSSARRSSSCVVGRESRARANEQRTRSHHFRTLPVQRIHRRPRITSEGQPTRRDSMRTVAAAKSARARAEAAAPAKPVQPKSKTKHGDNVDAAPSGDGAMPPSDDRATGRQRPRRRGVGGRLDVRGRRQLDEDARRRTHDRAPSAADAASGRLDIAMAGGLDARAAVPIGRAPPQSPSAHRRLPAPRATRRRSCRRRRSRRSTTWSARRRRRHPRRSRRRWRP